MRDVLQGPGRGIGVFTANGHSRTIAFCNEKLFPSIFVYSYPELTLRSELKGKFSSSVFSERLPGLTLSLVCVLLSESQIFVTDFPKWLSVNVENSFVVIILLIVSNCVEPFVFRC